MPYLPLDVSHSIEGINGTPGVIQTPDPLLRRRERAIGYRLATDGLQIAMVRSQPLFMQVKA